MIIFLWNYVPHISAVETDEKTTHLFQFWKRFRATKKEQGKMDFNDMIWWVLTLLKHHSEFRDFFPENSVEYFVSYYDYYQPEAYVPSSDTFIEKDAAINDQIEQMRLSATKALLEKDDVIIVATVSAIYGLGDPAAYHDMILHLKKGDVMDQRAILKRLAEMQYSRNDQVLERGNFRVRGDVIDIFPAGRSILQPV